MRGSSSWIRLFTYTVPLPSPATVSMRTCDSGVKQGGTDSSSADSSVRLVRLSAIPGYLRKAPRVDITLDIGQQEAEAHMRRLAREEGILAGVSSGGSLAGALRIAEQTENAVIVFIVCDRGDRYLSTGLFAPEV